MQRKSLKNSGRIAVAAAGMALILAASPGFDIGPGPGPVSLVPEIEGWTAAEAPQAFAPDSLYEYIDGAAESYLAYEFKELAVAQLQKPGTEASMTIEIYDMGNPLNAFGIYSVERYPENKVLDVGVQGYVEDEVLNFFAGPYYVKLVCFNGGTETAAVLEKAARKIAAKAKPAGAMPGIMALFPKDGLVANSEKYIRKNVLGFDFLRNGYLASYKSSGAEFDAFVIEPDKSQDPADLVKRLLEFFTKDKQAVESTALGYRIRSRYSQQMEVAVVRGMICSINRVPEAAAKGAGECFDRLAAAVKNR